MRFLIAAVLMVSFLTGCSQAETSGKKLQKGKPEQTEKVIKTLLKPLSARGVEVKAVRPVKEVKVPGFETFEVDLADKRNYRELKRYIFVNPEKKLIALQIFEYSLKGDRVVLKPLKPNTPEKRLKADVSFLKEVENVLSESKIPHVVGKGNGKVYVVWDIFCPFCYRHFNQIEDIAKKNNVEIHMIPLAVHGDNSIKGLVYYTKLAREKGVAGALKELYSLGNGDFMKFAKTLEEKLNTKEKMVEDQQKVVDTLKRVEELLIKHGIRATPTLIYVPPGEKQGYIHVGFIPIEKLVKENGRN